MISDPARPGPFEVRLRRWSGCCVEVPAAYPDDPLSPSEEGERGRSATTPGTSTRLLPLADDFERRSLHGPPHAGSPPPPAARGRSPRRRAGGRGGRLLAVPPPRPGRPAAGRVRPHPAAGPRRVHVP